MLEQEDIPYFVQNELGAYSTTIGAEGMTIMVTEANADRARSVIQGYLDNAS